MKNTFILFLSLLFTQNLIAQKNMVAGFIVKVSGDTIRGKIDDKDWNRNPTKIIFSTDDKEIKTYNVVKELSSFGVDNKSVYATKQTSLDITPNTYGSLLQTKERIVIADTVIVLKSLVKGKISLYFLKDANGKEHFFVEKLNEPLEELIEHQYITESGGKQGVVTEDLYNTQLAELCKDCSLFSGTDFNYQFTQASLRPAILKYNGFFGDKTAHETSKRESFSSNLFLQAGIGKYSYQQDYTGIYVSSSSNTTSFFGLGWLIKIPSNRKRWALRLDVNYSIIGDIPRFTYTPPLGKSLYLGFSLSPQFAIYKNEYTQRVFYTTMGVSLDNPLNNTENPNVLYPLNVAIYGLRGGFGYRLKKLNIECFYSYSGTGRRIGIDQNSMNRFMFALGYALF